MEVITVENGENFKFPKVTIMEDGELKFEIEEPIIKNKDKPKKVCMKYITSCTAT